MDTGGYSRVESSAAARHIFAILGALQGERKESLLHAPLVGSILISHTGYFTDSIITVTSRRKLKFEKQSNAISFRPLPHFPEIKK